MSAGGAASTVILWYNGKPAWGIAEVPISIGLGLFNLALGGRARGTEAKAKRIIAENDELLARLRRKSDRLHIHH